MKLPHFAALAALILLIGLGLTSSASANFVATGTDPAGDSTDPHPGRDIVRVGLTYDRRTGNMQGGVMLRGEPSSEAPANLTIFAGRRTATGCNGYPAIGFATQTDMRGADWVLLRSPTARPITGQATKTYEGRAEDYEATDWQLRGMRPNCVIAQLNEPGNSAVVYDVSGPHAVRGLPELEIKMGNVPTSVRPNRPQRIRVVVRNVGDGPSGRLRLAAGKARGLKVQMQRHLASIRPGARRAFNLRVTLNRRARSTTPLKLTAVGPQRLRAVAEEDLYLSRPRTPSRGGGGGGGDSSPPKLCFRYTWLPPFSQLVPC